MSTSQQAVRSFVPHPECKVSKEELLEDKNTKLGILDDCPICNDGNILCKIGCHPLRIQPGISIIYEF